MFVSALWVNYFALVVNLVCSPLKWCKVTQFLQQYQMFSKIFKHANRKHPSTGLLKSQKKRRSYLLSATRLLQQFLQSFIVGIVSIIGDKLLGRHAEIIAEDIAEIRVGREAHAIGYVSNAYLVVDQ